MKRIKILVLGLMILLVTSCGDTKELEGYWCNYEEKVIITILVDKGITPAQKEEIEDTINMINNLDSYDFISAEDLAMDAEVDVSDVLDSYIIYLKDSDYIDDSLVMLQSTKGVNSATKSVMKGNVTLYNLKNGEFTYQTELDDDIEPIKGKYKVKKNTIKFDKDDVNSIYIKDDFLCLDESCSKLLIETNSVCESN